MSWTVGFEDSDSIDEDETLVLAWIAKGGCDSDERVLEFELTADTNTTDSTSLSPGKYGFAAEARDLACRPIAFGCVERRLPSQTSAPVDLVLQAESAEPLCAPGYCLAGRCFEEEVDAGLTSIDAGIELVPTDSGASHDASASSALDGSTVGPTGGADAQAAADAGAGAVDSGLIACGGGSGVQRPGGHCYRSFEMSLSFYYARQLCASWGVSWGGASLVVPADAEEEAWVVATFNPQYDFWIGLTDVVVESVWMTPDYYAVADYHPWDPPNPNGGTSANCAYYYAPTSGWRDGSCFGTKRIICELASP